MDRVPWGGMVARYPPCMPALMDDKALLARLVAEDTTSGRPTKGLFDFTCEYLDRPEIRIERFPNPAGLENVLFMTGPDPSGDDGIALCGHVDTVPADEPEWTSDPRELVERDGRLQARGACDMKGFDAIAINLLAEHADAGFDRPLALLLTHSEEVGTIGAGEFVEHWPESRPFHRNVIVGEPTSLTPVRGHKGHLAIRFTVGGTPCHTGYPDDGVNAIEEAMPLLTALRELRMTLVEERTDASALFAMVPYPVLTIVRLEAGSAINVMPETCRIDVGVRLLPGQDATTFMERVHPLIDSSGLRLDEKGGPGTCAVQVLNNTPSFGTPSDDPFLARVLEVSEASSAIGVGYGTDAGRLEALGCHSVVFGPGDISVAHKPDEWMPCDEFARAPGLLRTIIAGSA